MEEYLAFTNKSVGRDKIYRTTQFACKLLAWSLKSNGGDYASIIEKIKKLESHAGLGRKFLRLGRSVHALNSAQGAINLLDPVLRVTLTTFYINQGVYLFLDHYLWMGKLGLVTVDSKWEMTAARFYHFSICLSILRDLYLLQQTQLALQGKDEEEGFNVMSLYETCKENPAATLDLIRNLIDLPLPASKLGYIANHDGVVAICGLMSSLIGAYQLLNPKLKPKP